MTYRIKNWQKFQHYKQRKPPWVKLYREILDDIEWHNLSGDASKMLVMCWLIASERDGQLPTLKQLSFRLRLTEKNTNSCVSELSHWIEKDASNTLADCKQDACLETETETETETERFTDFWKAYPKKIGKGAAEKAWKRIPSSKAVFEAIVAAVAAQKQSDQWLKDGGQFIPHPATWLNQRRWEDEVNQTKEAPHWSEIQMPALKK